MLVTILHNAVANDARADELDVLVQVDAVSNSLRQLGHEPVTLPVTLDLESLRQRLVEWRPAVAFNLVEALGGTDRLAPAIPLLLETLGIPCTGNGGDALYVTNSKRLTKRRLAAADIPTPAGVYVRADQVEVDGDNPATALSGRFLLKAVHEHASFAMDDGAVLEARGIEEVSDAVRARSARYGKPFFAERFIDGREFNLSVLAGEDRPTVLPPAEITFDAFPPDKPRIVGYAAKWESDSFEYNKTPRRFIFPPDDERLLDRLRSLAIRTWFALDLDGYARVDFRVDEIGQPWIIEANANPCLSPDAGFAAAIANAGIPYEAAIRRILAAAGGQEEENRG